jgi:hypothetical protein
MLRACGHAYLDPARAHVLTDLIFANSVSEFTFSTRNEIHFSEYV